ncbi:MAG: hypothetical protein KAS32_19765 [Candidatus Peribacteraceae bacterium]|nr:hypothetical protein [Candidatus Peribacteraceae bacterium]
MTVVTIPDFDFSKFYYPEVYQALLSYMRVNADELDSESDYETHIQVMRAFALVCHLNNTHLDVVANEQLLDSLELRESMIKLFELINVRLASATAAVATEVIRLSSVTSSDMAVYIPEFSTFGTESETDDNVEFETTEDLAMDRTDELSYVYAMNFSSSGTDGVVNTSAPSRLTSVGAAWTSADVGRYLMVTSSANGNFGEYLITARIDANTLEVAGAEFVTETSMIWAVLTYTDYTSEANDGITEFTPWPFAIGGSILYIGHNHIQWDQIDIDVGITPSIAMQGSWEYYDPTYTRYNPNTVVDATGKIQFRLDSFLTTQDVRGADVKVTYNPTGQSEVCRSLWHGANYNYIETKGLLGQTVVDLTLLNYTIESNWIPLINQVDGSSDMSVDGVVTFDWPMSLSVKWQKATINTNETYFLRYRTVDTLTPTQMPSILNLAIDQGFQYFPFEITQGETIEDEVIGTGDGTASQLFTSLQGPVFDDSFTAEVDELNTDVWTDWSVVENFLRSGTTDRHLKWNYDENGLLQLTSGNGKSGRVIPLNADVRIIYRIGGEDGGNAGAGEITDNIESVKYVAAIGNPMSAVGWSIKEGGNDEDIERMKEVGPSRLANDGKVVGSESAAYAAVNEYRTSENSKLVYRAYGIEEAYGLKTIKLVTVGDGGSFLNSDQLSDLNEYFNGNRYSIPEVEGTLVMNHELTAVNYEPYEVDVTVQVVGTGITINQVVNAISAYLEPLKENDDGSYTHDFGGLLAVVMLDCAIQDISPRIKNIIRTLPAADINLASNQLPTAGTITVTITES